MAKDLQTYPVMKNGTYIGMADAGQIAANSSLELYDEQKAATIKAQAEVDSKKAVAAKQTKAVDTAKAGGGADASAVKKGPAT